MGGGVIGYERHDDWDLSVNTDTLHQEFADTLLQAAFKLLKWCAENHFIKKKINEEAAR
uniref:Uncharacterized protein n=1 Tax=Dulem virus 40 TaxID=3145758 RepID=A0AAU8AWD5_9CAUD